MRSLPQSDNIGPKLRTLGRLCRIMLRDLRLPEMGNTKSIIQSGLAALKATTQNAIQDLRELTEKAKLDARNAPDPDYIVTRGRAVLLGVIVGILLLYLKSP